jgi:hypothetical protein
MGLIYQPPGVQQIFDLSTSLGDGLQSATTATTASGTDIPWTGSTGNGENVLWVSGRVPAGGFTLTSVNIDMWALESSMNANAAPRIRIYKLSTDLVLTELGGGTFDNGVEFGTAAALHSWTANVTDTAFSENERVLIRFYVTNAPTLVMGGGFTCQISYNGLTDGVVGNTKITLAETVAFKAEDEFSGEVLRLHCNGTDGSTTITDDSGRGHVFTCVNTAQIDTAQFKFGTASLRCDDSTNGFINKSIWSQDFAFKNLPYTIDMWIRPDAGGVTQNLFTTIGPNESTLGNDGSIALVMGGGNNAIFQTRGANRIAGTTALTTGSWWHVALTRDGSNNCRLFINGTQEGGTFADNPTFNTCGKLSPFIGMNGRNFGLAAPEGFTGWMDEIHVIRGSALWTANFTPPTAEYSDPVTASLAYDPQPAYMTPLLVR